MGSLLCASLLAKHGQQLSVFFLFLYIYNLISLAQQNGMCRNLISVCFFPLFFLSAQCPSLLIGFDFSILFYVYVCVCVCVITDVTVRSHVTSFDRQPMRR